LGLNRLFSTGLEMRGVDPPSRDRKVAGWAIVHDTTTISVHVKPNDLVAISAEFRGDKKRFKSNTIALPKSPKA